MKKIPFYHITVIIVMIVACSCKKSFLDTPPGSIIPRQTYVDNLQACKEVLNGVYLLVSTAYGATNALYPELIADNIKPIAGNTTMLKYYTWKQTAGIESSTPSNGNHINGYSYEFYKIISVCNFVIERADQLRNEDPVKADDIKGQALTIRALSHFMLVNVYAQAYNFTTDGQHPGVVYQKNADWTIPVNRRNTVNEVYTALISDLTAAIDLLPTDVSSTLRIGKYTALALLSRVYLFKQDYSNAALISKQVADHIPLMTIAKGYPDDLYKVLIPAQTEVLFHLLPGSSVSMGYVAGGRFAGISLRAPQKIFTATNDLGQLLTESASDVRSKWTVKSGTDWNVFKFPTGIIADVSPATISYYYAVIRASEIYLTAAEAYIQLNQEDNARYYLNLVKQRANPSASPVTTTGITLLNAIYKERRKEMAFEGLRMFDLQRWKQNVVRTDANITGAENLSYPNEMAIAPIPSLDVQLIGLKQNQGY